MISKEEDKMVSMGFNSINEGFDEGVSKALNFLTEIGTGYLNERKEPEAEKTVVSIKEIGKAATLQGMENAAVNAIRALERLLQCSIEQNMQDTTIRVLLSFGAIGKTAADKIKKNGSDLTSLPPLPAGNAQMLCIVCCGVEDGIRTHGLQSHNLAL